MAWLRVGLYKQAVRAYGYSGFRYRLDKGGQSTGHAGGLVRLLQGMGYIHNDWETECLHLRDTPEIDNKVGIAECRSPLGDHDIIISCVHYLLYGELHGTRRKELSFLYIDDLPGLGRRYQ